MQGDAVERDTELRKGVEGCFLPPPVKPVAPVFRELAKIGDIGAVGPGLAGRLVGKAGADETLAQVGEVSVWDVKRKGRGFAGHDILLVMFLVTFLVTFHAAVAPCAHTSPDRPLPAPCRLRHARRAARPRRTRLPWRRGRGTQISADRWLVPAPLPWRERRFR